MALRLEVVGPRAGNAPLEYRITEPGTFDIQSIFAHFNGAGASGGFRPVVTVRAQDGSILARVFPPTSLSTGDTADVTYAPFLRSEQAASSGGGLAFAYGTTASIASHPGGFLNDQNFTAVSTNDSSVFSYDGSTPARLRVNAPGLYLVEGQQQAIVTVAGSRAVRVQMKNGNDASLRGASGILLTTTWTAGQTAVLTITSTHSRVYYNVDAASLAIAGYCYVSYDDFAPATTALNPGAAVVTRIGDAY